MTEANVFQLSQPGTFTDPLTAVLRNGARALLAQAIEAEAAALLASHESARSFKVARYFFPSCPSRCGILRIASQKPLLAQRL